jgi:Ca-activated chloride channel family protein
MSFKEPLYLLLLLLVPLLVSAWVLRRRRAPRYAVRFPALASVREAAAAGGVAARPWRPFVPMTLLLASVAALAVSLAKPERTVAVPVERATIMLVTDHSRSMRADDVEPDRLAAAQKAAGAFLSQVPDEVRVGIVTFSDRPDAVQAPTTNHAAVRRIIDGQFPDGGTAIGDALSVALDSIRAQAEKGKRPPAAVVLLSDGKTTTGVDPVAVAVQARKLKIPIYTVALGTEAGIVPAPGLGGIGGYVPVPPDPETLRQIAVESGGRAFTAEDEDRLSSIYKSLGSKLGTKKRKREATAAFAAGALVLLLGAGLTSVRFSPALP